VIGATEGAGVTYIQIEVSPTTRRTTTLSPSLSLSPPSRSAAVY